jgi:hypothetical protein
MWQVVSLSPCDRKSISGVSAVNPLVALYNNNERKDPPTRTGSALWVMAHYAYV